jgi:actin-related protein
VGEEVVTTPEVLFRPSLVKKETPGLAELVKRAIGQCDLDTRKPLWENILLVGATSASSSCLISRGLNLIPRLCRETAA